jgi:predicted nucleic acid-binding protein
VDRAVVDASVAIKWTIDEANSDAALRLTTLASLVAPKLLLTECVNVLWRKVRIGELTAEQAAIRLGYLSASPIDYIDDAALLPVALKLAISLDHPVYDCLYVAASVESGAPLVTADARLYRKIAAAGFKAPPILLDNLRI